MDTAIIRHLSPTALALLSVELTGAELTLTEIAFLTQADEALEANVGDDEAEQLRQWCRDNV